MINTVAGSVALMVAALASAGDWTGDEVYRLEGGQAQLVEEIARECL